MTRDGPGSSTSWIDNLIKDEGELLEGVQHHSFTHAELQFNILEHPMQPRKFRVLQRGQTAELERIIGEPVANLPKIHPGDILARMLLTGEDDVITFERDDPVTATMVEFRHVQNSDIVD